MIEKNGFYEPTEDEVILLHQMLIPLGIDPEGIAADGVRIYIGGDGDGDNIAYISVRTLLTKVDHVAAREFVSAIERLNNPRFDDPPVIETWQV